MHARNFSHILVGVVYDPPGVCELICTNHIISSIDEIITKHLYTGVMLHGDFNNLNDTRLRSYPLKQVVRMATRRSAILGINLTTYTDCTILQKFYPSSFLITMLSFMSQPSHFGISQVNLST